MAAALALQEPVLREMVFGREHGRHLARPAWRPLDRPLRTADGWLAVDLAGDDGARGRLACVAGADASDGDAAIAVHLATRAAAEWAPLLRDAGIPGGVIREELSDLPADPIAAGALERVNGACWMPAAPWRMEA
jgi:crotonobetainyl-CoA:carnitine CoA-transferase CaiB-like acyl-CoA transferase